MFVCVISFFKTITVSFLFYSLVSFLPEAVVESQQAFSTSTSPNELSSQPSRRGSLFDLQQGRVSNQNVIGHSPTGIAESSTNEFRSSDKYMQDSFETEKPKSNRSSPNTISSQSQSNGSNRKGSIRFYNEIQSADDTDKKKDETASILQEDSSIYKKNEHKYIPNVQEYRQTNQSLAEPQQELFYDSQLDYTGQPLNVYESGQYDGSQYNDQQNYDGVQYRTEDPQPSEEYEYQSGYQGYDTQQQTYQSNKLPSEPLQQEPYGTELYQERSTKPNTDTRTYQTVQQHQNYADSISKNSNMGQNFKGNGNGNGAVRLPNMSKQSTTKNFT